MPSQDTSSPRVITTGSFRFSRKARIPKNRVVEINGGELLTRLYRPQHASSFVDFSSDENGLWAVFALALDNNTVVTKFEPESLEIQYMWNISLNHFQGRLHTYE